MDNYNEREE